MNRTGFYYESIIGRIGIVEENGFITNVLFANEDIAENVEMKETSEIFKASKQLEEYFIGNRRDFEIKIKPIGTEFQKKVWKALCEIPYGEFVSYKYIAEKISCPKGYRAVGLANNKNPLPIIVPCHRVIGSNGKLVGFAGGLGIKETLMNIERGLKK